MESGSCEVCPGAWSSVDDLGRKEFRSELIASVGWLPEPKADFPVVWLFIKYPAVCSYLCVQTGLSSRPVRLVAS